jgi:hypothetical protein
LDCEAVFWPPWAFRLFGSSAQFYWYCFFVSASAGGVSAAHFGGLRLLRLFFRMPMRSEPGRPEFKARRFHTPVENAIYLLGTSATRPWHLHWHAVVSSRAVESRASARSQALDATCVSRKNYVVHGDASFCAERKIPTNIGGIADKLTVSFRRANAQEAKSTSTDRHINGGATAG